MTKLFAFALSSSWRSVLAICLLSVLSLESATDGTLIHEMATVVAIMVALGVVLMIPFTWVNGRLHVLQTSVIGNRLLECAANGVDFCDGHGLLDVVLAMVAWRIVAIVVTSGW